MKYCSKCGEKNLQNDSYCSNCGSSLRKPVSKKIKNNPSVAKDNASYIEIYKHVLQNYFNLNGRASRKEYWVFFLMSIGFIFAISIIESYLKSDYSSEEGLFSSLFYLFTMIPSFTVGVRRMHDVGKSGLWLFIPIIGFISTFESGEKGENQYGPESYI